MNKIFLIGAVILSFFGSNDAAPGDLDSSFNTDGKVTTVVENNSYSRSSDIAIQPDGKLIVVGISQVLFRYVCLVRYNPDGSPDLSFDGDGIVITPLAGSYDGRNMIASVAIQTDGKILVGGTFGSQSGDDFVIIRYNADGSLDTSFDTDGFVRTDFAGDTDRLTGLKIQPDGKILAAGNTAFPKRIALARYNPDGSLDNTFDADGKVDFPLFSSIHSTTINDVALLSNGGIVIVGSTVDFFQGDYSPVVVCLNPNGSLNTNFDGDGSAVIANLATDDIFYGVAIQPNNKIVAVGVIETRGMLDYRALVVRYNPDGTLDPSFNGDGIVITADGPFATSGLVDVAIQSNGKIVAFGGFYGDFLLARYNPDGTLDNSLFGNGGIVATDFSNNSGDFPSRLLIQPDGKIVAAGYTSIQNSFTEEFAVARYLGDPVAPTSANVSISGQVLSGKSGINRVTVSLTDSSGVIRTAATNSFGNYSFDEVPAGQIYVISVVHKKYVFNTESQILNVSEDLSGIDFTANE